MANNPHMIAYRRAGRTDLSTMTELLCELYEGHSHDELLAENEAHFDDGKQAFFIAYDGDKSVGVCHGARRSEYVNGKAYDGPVGYLEAIYVSPAYRLCGIASALVALCETWVRENGCNEFLSDCLLDNTDSYKFHIRVGFAETERCIFFRKELAGCSTE